MSAPLTAFAGARRKYSKPMDMRALGRTIAWRVRIAEQHRQLAARHRPSPGGAAACPICASGEHTRFVAVYAFEYRACGGCGHLFLANPPDGKAIAGLYEGSEEEKTPQAAVYVGEEIFRKRVEAIARPKAAFCAEHLPADGIWVDIGCGTGELLYAVRERGWRVRGYEADEAEVALARAQGIEVIQTYVDALGADDLRDVGVLSFLNVLEHVLDPAGLFARLTAALPSGRHAVVEVPRHPSLSSFSNLLFPQLAARHIYSPDHLHVFTERSLERLLDAAGFEAAALWTFGQDYQELVYTSAASAGLAESEFFGQVVDIANHVQRAIDEAHFSDTMLVIAKKR